MMIAAVSTGELQSSSDSPPGVVQAGGTYEIAGRAWAWPPELVLFDDGRACDRAIIRDGLTIVPVIP